MNESNLITRRGVVGLAGAAGLGMMAAPYILRAAENNDLIRVGLIGCGGRGTGAAQQTLSVPGSNVKLTAMADAFDTRLKGALKSLSKKFEGKVDVPADRQFTGLDAYQKVLDHCDMVILATPPGFRPYHFEAAVKAGKHVFMEKPVCVDSFGARSVLETSRQADSKNLRVVVGLQRHYQASYRETIKRVQDGMAGDLICGNVYWNGGPIWHRKREEGQNELQFQVHNWYHFNWLCGDHICEQHVHNLDVANWFLGALPETAVGFGGRQGRNIDQPTEIYDHHSVVYMYPNGVVVNSQCCQISGAPNNVSEEFRGTKGIVSAGRIRDYKGNVIWQHDGKGDIDPYQVEHNELHDAIRNSKRVNNAEYGATSTFTAVLGRNATYTGQKREWKKDLALNFRTMPEGNIDWNTAAPVQPMKDGQYRLPAPGEYKLS